MKKNVCSLIDAGIHYNVYYIDGAFVKENLSTGEIVPILLEEYDFYYNMYCLNMDLLKQKGLLEDVDNVDEKEVSMSDDTEVKVEEYSDKKIKEDDEFEYYYLNNVDENEFGEAKISEYDDEEFDKTVQNTSTVIQQDTLGEDDDLTFFEEFEKDNTKNKKKRKSKIKDTLHKVFKSRKPKIGRKGKKILTTIAAAALGLSLLVGGGIAAYKYASENKAITLEADDNLFLSFNEALDKNETVEENVKLEIMKYMQILFRYDLSLENYQSMLDNIVKLDFTGVKEISILELEALFSYNRNANLIAEELYNFRHEISKSTNPKFQLISNVIAFDDAAIKNLLEGKNIDVILEQIFNVQDTIDLANPDILEGDGLNTENFVKELKAKKFGTLTSECELENNIFSSNIKIYDHARECYLYFDKKTEKGINDYVYSQLLTQKLYDIENFNYENVQERELFYFYVNSLFDTAFISDDPVEQLMNGTKGVFAIYDTNDLMKCLSGNVINHTKAVNFYGLVSYGKDAVPLLQEINMCLKLDVQEGLIDESAYQIFIDQLYVGLEFYAPDMIDEFTKSDKANESMKGYSLDLFKSSPI